MRFWSSDWHLGHKRIIELCDRPFGSVEEMDEEIVDNINAVCKPEDELVLLGDVCMGKLEESLALLSRIHARITLLPGNHDRMSPAYGHNGDAEGKRRRFAAMYLQAMGKGGAIVYENPSPFLVGGRVVLASHFPYAGDSQENDRHLEHRPVDGGLPLIHGHVHEKWQENGHMLNVGVDVWDFMPVPEIVIEEWVASLPTT